jgi:predicted  nucleic acid-binding Zn-ribbon protein
MNGWFNPDSWMDVWSQFLLILGALSIAIAPSWFSARKTHKDLRDVKDQVKNGHTNTNLRDDLDRVLERLEELSRHVTEISRGFSALKSELIDEEIHRRESVKELRSDLRDGMSHIDVRLTELEGDINSNG